MASHQSGELERITVCTGWLKAKQKSDQYVASNSLQSIRLTRALKASLTSMEKQPGRYADDDDDPLCPLESTAV